MSEWWYFSGFISNIHLVCGLTETPPLRRLRRRRDKRANEHDKDKCDVLSDVKKQEKQFAFYSSELSIHKCYIHLFLSPTHTAHHTPNCQHTFGRFVRSKCSDNCVCVYTHRQRVPMPIGVYLYACMFKCVLFFFYLRCISLSITILYLYTLFYTHIFTSISSSSPSSSNKSLIVVFIRNAGFFGFFFSLSH